MSTLVAEPSLLERVGGQWTLDDVLASSWRTLLANRAIDCPVCGAEMTPHAAATRRPAAIPHAGATPQPVGGHCQGCGSQLA